MTRPDIPPDLEVRVTPSDAPVGTPATLEVSLRNPGPGTRTVNARLLLVPAGTVGGELELEVQGPPGYCNSTGFRVRAGEPGPEDFADLSPGERVSRAWPLEKYQSLHLPGDYRLTATYRNQIAHAPDGRPVVVTTRSTSVAFRRSAPGEEGSS